MIIQIQTIQMFSNFTGDQVHNVSDPIWKISPCALELLALRLEARSVLPGECLCVCACVDIPGGAEHWFGFCWRGK